MPKTYQGRHGEYIIITEAPGKFLVKYISGQWKGQEVWMNRQLHNRIQENIGIDIKIDKDSEIQYLNDLLDLWYDKYPALYKSLWQDGITGESLLKKLEAEYPDAATNVNLELEG